MDITSKRTVDLLNTKTDKIGNGISPFSNNENWQKILTWKKYIHKEKNPTAKQTSATKSKQLKISCLMAVFLDFQDWRGDISGIAVTAVPLM